MKTPSRRILAAVLPLLALLSGCASLPEAPKPQTLTPAEAATLSWSPLSAATARYILDEYGQPDVVNQDSLVWLYNGPWARTTVRNLPAPPNADRPSNVLEQMVPYEMTANDAAEVEAFSPHITADPLRAELSSTSDSEETNYLTLNLADEIVNKRMTVSEARAYYDKTLLLSDSGKSSRYTGGLLFSLEK